MKIKKGLRWHHSVKKPGKMYLIEMPKPQIGMMKERHEDAFEFVGRVLRKEGIINNEK